MTKTCVAYGCSNSMYNGTPVHKWPKDPKVSQKWTRFVNCRRAQWRGPSAHSVICSSHFTPSDFHNYGMWKAGLTRRLDLRPGAVPTIWTCTQTNEQCSRAPAVIEENRVAMEQCEPAHSDKVSAQGLGNSKLDAAASSEKQAGEVNGEVNDIYECRFCGYKATDVCSLSQHLHSLHPVTGMPGPKPQDIEDSEEADENAVLVDVISEEKDSAPAGNHELSDESMSSSPMDSMEDTSTSTCNVDNQVPAAEQKETEKNLPVAKVSQSTSSVSILPRRKSSSSSESIKENQSEDAASSGTSSLNQTRLVCLPLVSEGLKLVWVRSEQTHELDAISELVEAFNVFPYPTEQEARALARRCSLSPERVKVWFMMQRVRYGISWDDNDIRQTRIKLHRLQRPALGEQCEERTEQHFLAHQETPMVLEPTSVLSVCHEQAYHIPKAFFPQDEAIDYSRRQFSISPQNSNGSEPFIQHQTHVQFTGELENAPPDKNNGQLHMDLQHLPHQEAEAESSSTFGYTPKLEGSRRGPRIQQRKKSKDQLILLRRSFVQTNWPAEAEVQRLQRVTGLGRHEIRKWFADSRYQLRRSGRSWVTEMTRQNQMLNKFEGQTNDDDYPEYGEPISTGEGLEYDLDVDMVDQQDGVGESGGWKKNQDEPELVDNPAAINKERKDVAVVPSPSPASSSPSPSLLQGYNPSLGPEPNLRKKTWEQLNMLRQSFLQCQWPTSDDYTLLQQKTGLTRTEIVQWYGDTRYHIKHSSLRWVQPEDRERVRMSVLKQQKRAGKGPRNRGWLEPTRNLVGSQPNNGSGATERRTWEELYKATSSVLPGGEL